MKDTTLWTARVAVALLSTTVMWLPVYAAEKIITPIEEITTELTGKFATVQGVVTGERRFKSGMRYTVSDDTGKITLVLFDRELKQAPKPDVLTEGATVSATGKVDFFNDEAQLVPIRGTDVIIVKSAPPVRALAINALSAADIDKTVAVRGSVTEALNFSAGFKLKLNDGTGQIAVTLFENVFDGLAKPEQINVGSTLTVTGKVNEFSGDLEIVPSTPNKIVVASPPSRGVQTYTLASITGNDHNAVVQVEGEIASLDKFENGVDALLKDATGAQKVRLWQVVANRVTVKLGDKVNVIGRVKASRAKGVVIEVALPSDITVKK